MLERILARILQLNRRSICLPKNHITYSANAETAGTHLELCCVSDSTLLVKIAKGEQRVIAFPSKFAGPDVWGLLTSQHHPIVFGAQLKLENRVFGRKRFLEALASLNPSSMYSSAIQTEKAAWRSFLPEFERMRYLAARAFSPKVHYMVAEYNEKHPLSGITLLSLADLEPDLGRLYQLWLPELGTESLETEAIPTPILQSEWLRLNDSQRKKNTVATLQEMCKLRHIKLSTDHRQKKKDDLLRELNSFRLDDFLKELQPTYH